MPCYDPRSDSAEGLIARASDALPREKQDELVRAAEEWRHNSPVAELLCEAMKLLSQFGNPKDGRVPVSRELFDWWAEHQNRDALKQKLDEARAKGLI